MTLLSASLSACSLSGQETATPLDQKVETARVNIPEVDAKSTKPLPKPKPEVLSEVDSKQIFDEIINHCRNRLFVLEQRIMMKDGGTGEPMIRVLEVVFPRDVHVNSPAFDPQSVDPSYVLPLSEVPFEDAGSTLSFQADSLHRFNLDLTRDGMFPAFCKKVPNGKLHCVGMDKHSVDGAPDSLVLTCKEY